MVGQTALRQGDHAQAAASFDRIVAHAEPGELRLHAMFQSALAHEAEGDRAGAAQRFGDIGRSFPESALAPEAWLRCMRLQLYTDNWQAAGESARTYLERYPDAGPRGQIVANAARALALHAVGQQERAEYVIAKGLAVVDRYGLDRAGRIPADLAELYFALGEARRQRADAAQLDPDTRHFSASLERRCQLLLDAQSAYSDSMRAYDAHWSTMAGYRVGELYQRLHAELMVIPAPRAATLRQQRLFEGAMRLRYTVLLRKASTMLDHTLALARRTGEDSEWVRRAEESRSSIARALVDEQAALDRLPFSGTDLQRALDDLLARSAGPRIDVAPKTSRANPAR
ncbi:MAG TPA: tetratricopeptide repeat protein [Polyangiaceae bacterium]|nr:tetratricopeptide repeat protein [Polyangiaceae bacterium]